MHWRRVITGLSAKKRQDQINLRVDAEQAKCRINEHPLDLVDAKKHDIKNRVNDNGKTTVQIKKAKLWAIVRIGHEKARLWFRLS